MLERFAWAVVNGEVLRGDGVAVFESAVADAFAMDTPALYDGLHGFGGADGSFGEAIECEGARADGEVGEFLNLKVVGDAAEFHGGWIQ